ncbi:site-specific integrase [Rhizobium sp. CB3171]|uniref:site-specific integrase n=1 Tax=Rhizobium sp. CB3171 TaxID=3039157 RepID=UPI0024B126EB|nr:site-specific integrase [Rhizobium sp. CB3171]WFU02282.1 site-specific integrase [Rhizobium sp. CB3171]
MQRRPSGIYEFRRRLPQALAGKPVPEHAKGRLVELINPTTGNFKQYLSISLHTSDYNAAKRKDLREAGRVTDLFADALELVRNGPSITPTIEPSALPSFSDIEAEVLGGLLADDEKIRKEGDARRSMQTAAERTQWNLLEHVPFGSRGTLPSHLVVIGLEAEELAPDYRDAYARRDPEIVRSHLHRYLSENRLPIDPSSEFYYEAGLAILRSYVKFYDAVERRQRGEEVVAPIPVKISKGPKLTEAFKLWQGGTQARGGKKPAPSTVREAERVVRYFKEWHGDLHLADITKEKARDFRNALAKLPTRLAGEHRALPLRALLKATEGKGELVHGASVNKYLNLLVAIVSAVEKEGLLDSVPGFANPFTKLGLVIDKRNDPNRREPFSDGDLTKLFTDKIYQRGVRPKGGSGEAAYWFPLIALLSGARLNEIAQLRIKDIRQDPESSIWFVDIGTEGGRSIKTPGSRRQVPLHGDLIRLGLLQYREHRLKEAAKEDATLWPEVTSADPAYRSTAWSKWFNRYLRVTIGIKDPSIVFHSFRHTFKRLARDAELSEELHDALTGHVGVGGVGRSYGAGFGLRALHDAITKIEAPKAVKALAEWKAKHAMEVKPGEAG